MKKSIQFVVRDPLYSAISLKAKQQGLSLSAYVRSVLTQLFFEPDPNITEAIRYRQPPEQLISTCVQENKPKLK